MNVGRAITAGMYAERVRDLERFAREIEWRYVVHAYAWWGWDISGRGGLGRPGVEISPRRGRVRR